MSRIVRKTAAGFTTLEVLCATALSAMLMVAVMGLVAGLSKHERILRNKSPQADWQRRLVRQLESDVARSWQLALLSDGFQLIGPLDRDAATGAPTWKNARVTYRLVDSPLGRLLVREVANEVQRSANSHTEITCFGAVGIELCAATETPIWQLGQPPLQTTLRPGSLPNEIRVLVYGQDGRALVDQFCLVH